MNCMPSCTSFSREIISPQINSAGSSWTAYRFQQTLTTVSGTYAAGGAAASWPNVGVSSVGAGQFGVLPVQQDPAFVSMNANYQDVRTVAMSVRLQCTQPALTAQGFVHMAVVPEDLMGSATWQYPASFSAMERAPFYQKVPLANLINNTPTIALPIMDEGAWRYRNVGLLPSQVGNSFLQAATNTANVEVEMYGTQNTASSGLLTVVFPYPFATVPDVGWEVVGQSGNNNVFSGIGTAGPTVTGFSAQFQQTSGNAAAVSAGNDSVQWTATGLMTPANAAAYYTSIGAAQPLVGTATVAAIPGIETTYGWGAIIIALEGVGGYSTTTATSPIEVEIIRHYEAIPNDIAGNVITGTPASPPSQALLEANKTVQMRSGPIAVLSDDGLDTSKDSSFMSTAQRALQIGSYMGSALGAAGVPFAGAVGTAMGTFSRSFVSFCIIVKPLLIRNSRICPHIGVLLREPAHRALIR